MYTRTFPRHDDRVNCEMSLWAVAEGDKRSDNLEDVHPTFRSTWADESHARRHQFFDPLNQVSILFHNCMIDQFKRSWQKIRSPVDLPKVVDVPGVQ